MQRRGLLRTQPRFRSSSAHRFVVNRDEFANCWSPQTFHFFRITFPSFWTLYIRARVVLTRASRATIARQIVTKRTLIIALMFSANSFHFETKSPASDSPKTAISLQNAILASGGIRYVSFALHILYNFSLRRRLIRRQVAGRRRGLDHANTEILPLGGVDQLQVAAMAGEGPAGGGVELDDVEALVAGAFAALGHELVLVPTEVFGVV